MKNWLQLLVGIVSIAAFCFSPANGLGAESATRYMPPPGIPIPPAARAELEEGVAKLGREIETLSEALKSKPQLLALGPDVQIYHKALHWPLAYDEFLRSNEVAIARTLLNQGLERAAQLRAGTAPWAGATGLVVRGYVSKIDGSIQPYGLVVPASFRPNTAQPFRLDIWLHGRDNNLTELKFIDGRQKSAGEFAPPHTFVLHLYGRYCNANKFAGEVDLFEALAQVRRQYPIDENRITVRGFSMGGAACWHLAAHHAGLWAAAAPGAGFAETAEYLKIPLSATSLSGKSALGSTGYQPVPSGNLPDGTGATSMAGRDAGLTTAPRPIPVGRLPTGAGKLPAPPISQTGFNAPPWYEQELWHLYNATDYAANLFNCPVVAYSGELDKQRQTADLMAEVLKTEGLELTHIIGPQTEHRYHPQAKEEVSRRIDSLAALGRNPVPRQVRFTTWTLRYNQMHWVTIDGLEKHWERARVEAEIGEPSTVRVQTTNVTALTLSMPSGLCPLDNTRRPTVRIDGVDLEAAPVMSDRSWTAHFRKTAGRWAAVAAVEAAGLRKRHGLQGPIDDAFMDSFIFVRPTGQPLNEKVGGWVAAEMQKAGAEWRAQFRGEVRIKNDTEITDADIAASHLILWGDPASNRILRRVAEKLPFRWNDQTIDWGKKSVPASHHLPVCIFPNPLKPERYVVLNTGFTFHHPKSSSNADQTPKLPDYALVDLDALRSLAVAGGIVAAGFFDEGWAVPDEVTGGN